MEKIQVGIEALVRASENEPWQMTFSTPGTNVRMTIALGDEVEVGPRFREVLNSIEKSQVYPRTIKGRELDLLGMATQDSFVVKMLSSVPAHVEISFKPYRQYFHPKTPKVKGELTEWSMDEEWGYKDLGESPWLEMLAIPSGNVVADAGGAARTVNANGTALETTYLVVGKLVSIVDGDTIIVKVEDRGAIASRDTAIAAGKEIKIRFAGVNTAETIDHGEAEGNRRNADYMEKYKLESAEAFKVGEQARKFVTDFFKTGDKVVLDLDITADGQLKLDVYGRYVAAVYASSQETSEILTKGISATQLNKALLGTMATGIKDKSGKALLDVPLAMPYYAFIDKEFSRLNPGDWLYDVGVRSRNEERVGEQIKRSEADKKANSNPIEGQEPIEVKAIESRTNTIEYMEAYDDRLENSDTFVDAFEYNCRIGDVMLVVPPLSIDANRVSNIQKVKTLRSKSSMIVKGGSSMTTITLELYFHDLDSINGRRVKANDKWDRYYYIDGLRPLIAQFKKAPFVPIDNKYINEILGIDSVALVNLNVQTVPGFPHSLVATLTLAKFEHASYMPQVTRLGDTINYPMFRWYYQEPLRDDLEYYSEYRTWLKKIPNSGLTNDFVFQKVNEEHLIERKTAIQNLRNMTSPILMQSHFENPGRSTSDGNVDDYTLMGQMYKDGLAAQRALDMYNRYLDAKKKGLVTTERTDQYVEYPPEDKMIKSKENHGSGDGLAAWELIYGVDKGETDVAPVSHYAPKESLIYYRNMLADEAIPDTQQIRKDAKGYFKLRLYSQVNIDYVKSNGGREILYEGNLHTLRIGGAYLSVLNKIIQRGREAESAYLSAQQEWNETKAKVEATEGQMPLEDWTIDGVLIPTSMNVMYENQFSSAQVQFLDSPSLQFLGGQDPYVQVSFEADEQAVESLRTLFETTEQYAREYRTGITSGFLGVKNHLIQLFGIDTVMPESLNIRTVPGYPGRFEVQMVLCGFNKTQKRMETLEGISPIYGDYGVDRESRKAGVYQAEQDDAIIQKELNRMELYPDLELPKLTELLSVLPYLDAKCDFYELPNGETYLPPDFYVATPNTLRSYMSDNQYEDHELVLSDFMGVEMVTSSGSDQPVTGTEEMWKVLQEMEEKAAWVRDDASWSGDAMHVSGGTSNLQGVTFADEKIESYIKDRQALKTPPGFEDWKLIMGVTDTSGTKYMAWLTRIDPEEWEVYNEIYKLVDEFWIASGYAYDDRKKDVKDPGWQKITYATNDDLKDLMWNHLVSKDPKLLKDGQKAVHKLDNVTQKDFQVTNWLPTREFIANMIKSVIHARSKWKQRHASGLPILTDNGNICGIGGVPLSSEAADVNQAKRLVWDWKYNLRTAVSKMFQGYKAASDDVDLKFKYHPWDWMICAYERGTIRTTVAEMESPFWSKVHSIHNKVYRGYDKLYATPTAKRSLAIMQQKNGYDSDTMAMIKGDKTAIIKELMAVGYRKDKKNEKETKAWLESKAPTEVAKIYEDYMKAKVNVPKQQEYASGPDGGQAAKASTNLMIEERNQEGREALGYHAEIYDMYMDAKDYVEDIDTGRLVQTDSPQDVFPEMLTDMLHYDQRMRLIRAFPTFQMFIVDEGRWMTNYRLWDNLYGFNAIQSIDVHRSRKIAADTAVITMTNMYSNLSTRTLDTTYGEWDYKFWDNLVFGNPSEEMLAVHQELQSSLLLQTGARIHLRIGYGSAPDDLPVVFNGTITEMSTGDVVQIIAQGDGIELGNIISGDPDEDNNGIFKVTEPRDLICQLLTTKGNWFKNFINDVTGGAFYKDSPLGIQHFGQPGEKVPEGAWKGLGFFEYDYGEAAQNIYSSSGVPTYSQWTYADGSDIPWTFDTPILKWFQPGDEQNIVVPYYNNTVWDIVQTLAYCSTDYIAAVHPFEMRSTLFFGKPYWRLAYQYDSTYEYDEQQNSWIRYRNTEHRKPYAQFHLYTSESDIISNGVKASEEGIYTNVIVNYDDSQTKIQYADIDIRLDKHKTTVVDAEIVARNFIDFWTSEKQAEHFGASTIRDYMKEMYKGQLVVLGDPSVKPHDICYMKDDMYDMNGCFMVRAVTHNFSHETGFVTTIEPDALVVNDDMALLSISNWGASMLAKDAIYLSGAYAVARGMRKITSSSYATKAIQLGKKGGIKATEYALAKLADSMPDTDEEVIKFRELIKKLRNTGLDSAQRAEVIKEIQDSASKVEKNLEQWKDDGNFKNEAGKTKKGKGSYSRMKRTVSVAKQSANALTDGGKAFRLIRGASAAVSVVNPLALAATAVSTWAVETIFEKYRRAKGRNQTVILMPLMYQGRQYTAGINGHKGMVVGDAQMGKLDSFMSGMGLDGVDGNSNWEWIMDTWNWLADAEGRDYTVTREDLMKGIQSKDGEGQSFWSE